MGWLIGFTTRGRIDMSFRPFSWFSDWAGKLGIPIWTVYVAAVVVGYLILSWLGIVQ
jgi:hypothetical protein